MPYDTSAEAIRERLRACGLRPTRQREELAGLLFGSGDRHVTAEGLHRETQTLPTPDAHPTGSQISAELSGSAQSP